MTKFLLLSSLLTACATDDRSPTHSVTWSVGLNDSGAAVQCTTDILSPCPFLLYTRGVRIEPDERPGFVSATSTAVQLTWSDATGGTLDGQPAEALPNEFFLADDSNGDLRLRDNGDDGGLRLGGTLAGTDGRYDGDVTWLLTTGVPGRTTWHLTLTAR